MLKKYLPILAIAAGEVQSSEFMPLIVFLLFAV